MFATCNRDLLTRIVGPPAFSTQFGTVAIPTRSMKPSVLLNDQANGSEVKLRDARC
jgi:hypothetical protein